jgi:hypothetical protein
VLDRPRQLAIALVAVVLTVGCVAAPNPPGPTASPTAQAPSPSTRVLADGTDPAPTMTPTPDPPTLRRDTLARVVAAGGVTAWERAAAEGRALREVSSGAVVYLDRHGRAADGSSWWRIPLDGFPATVAWIPERTDDLAPTLEPVVPDCPDPTFRLTTAELPADSIVRLACFGSRPLELVGDMTCQTGWAELAIQGAPWTNDQEWCLLDDSLWVDGEAATSLIQPLDGTNRIGPVIVHGQFDRPGAEHCIATSFGVSLGFDPDRVGERAAILQCRQQLVATEVLRR